MEGVDTIEQLEVGSPSACYVEFSLMEELIHTLKLPLNLDSSATDQARKILFEMGKIPEISFNTTTIGCFSTDTAEKCSKCLILQGFTPSKHPSEECTKYFLRNDEIVRVVEWEEIENPGNDYYYPRKTIFPHGVIWQFYYTEPKEANRAEDGYDKIKSMIYNSLRKLNGWKISPLTPENEPKVYEVMFSRNDGTYLIVRIEKLSLID